MKPFWLEFWLEKKALGLRGPIKLILVWLEKPLGLRGHIQWKPFWLEFWLEKPLGLRFNTLRKSSKMGSL